MGNTSQEQRRILILAEKEDQGFASITFELIAIGRKIANDLSAILGIALFGHEISDVAREIVPFADEVFCLDHPLLASFQAEFYSSALEQLYKKVNADAVLMGHTLNNLSLAPKIGHKFGVQVITDCIQLVIEHESENLLCSKPVYGGRIISTFRLRKKPYIVTFRPKSIESARPALSLGKIIHFDPTIDETLLKFEVIERIEEESVSLNKAAAIVAGGRGIKNAESLERLKELLIVLRKYFSKVELGVSRPLVDAHLVPPSRQIGLTGEKVSPELYIGVGISGSSQHVTGILGAKKIIAINISPEAPIFEVADCGVIGDCEDVLPILIKELGALQ